MNAQAQKGKALPALVVFALVALATISGCARARSHEASTKACACEDPNANLVDQALMAWLSKARSLHHLADLAEEAAGEASVDQAIAPLEQLVTGALAPGNPPEVREVLADTYARLAELRARRGDFARGDFERADQDVTAGLGFAPERSYFSGHLLEVRGLIYDKLSQHLEKAGKSAEAKVARQKAMQASFEAVRMQDDVIKSALVDAGSKARD